MEPDAYACQHCNQLTLLTESKDGRKPARSVNALPVDPQAEKAALRVSRADELEQQAHEQQVLQLERKKLSLEIDVARLKRDINRPEPKVVDPHQARVNAMADKMNSVAANCRTMQDAIAQLRALHVELDRSEPDEKVRQQLKDAFSMQFEEIFRALGAEIRV
jgi:hypothetical protein